MYFSFTTNNSIIFIHLFLLDNGGDGYVAARHLIQFGYSVTIVVFKAPSKEHFVNLTKACKINGVKILNYTDDGLDGKLLDMIKKDY